MTPERQKNPVLPALKILSEATDRPEYYDRVWITGTHVDDDGNAHFILGIKQENGEMIPMRSRVLPERADDLRRYEEALKSLQKK